MKWVPGMSRAHTSTDHIVPVDNAAATSAASLDERLWARLCDFIDRFEHFRIVSFDGLYWADPYAGRLVRCGTDLSTFIADYYRKNAHWRRARAKSRSYLRGLVWIHHLRQHVFSDPRYQLFDHEGRWFNPVTQKFSLYIRRALDRKSFLRHIAEEMLVYPDSTPNDMPGLAVLQRRMAALRDQQSSPADGLFVAPLEDSIALLDETGVFDSDETDGDRGLMRLENVYEEPSTVILRKTLEESGVVPAHESGDAEDTSCPAVSWHYEPGSNPIRQHPFVRRVGTPKRLALSMHHQPVDGDYTLTCASLPGGGLVVVGCQLEHDGVQAHIDSVIAAAPVEKSPIAWADCFDTLWQEYGLARSLASVTIALPTERGYAVTTASCGDLPLVWYSRGSGLAQAFGGGGSSLGTPAPHAHRPLYSGHLRAGDALIWQSPGIGSTLDLNNERIGEQFLQNMLNNHQVESGDSVFHHVLRLYFAVGMRPISDQTLAVLAVQPSGSSM